MDLNFTVTSFDPAIQRAVNTGVAMALFFAIAWGLMFKDMLEYEVNRWNKNRKTQATVEIYQPSILFTYAITCLLTVVFSVYSFLAFGFPLKLAGIFSLIMVLVPAILIWVQLGSLLQELVVGGSQAIEIDEAAILAAEGMGMMAAAADSSPEESTEDVAIAAEEEADE